MFRLPAARIEVVTSLAGSASPWQATDEEVGDTEFVHAVAPAATLRVVLFPSPGGQSPANATADMLAGLRLAVSHTDVASISWSLGEHYFTEAQVAEMHSILLGAAAHHVTVIGSSGNGGWFPIPRGWGGQVKEVSLPASDPLVLGVGGTTLTANRSTGAYIGETAWTDSGGGFSHLYARPAYQDGVPGISKTRGVPDVAGDADEGGMARVETAGWRGIPLGAARHQQLRAAVGGTRGVGRPVRPSRPWLRQPRHLRHRPQLQLPQGISRHYERYQRLPGRSRMGPGNGLGNPQRAGAHPAAGPLRQ